MKENKPKILFLDIETAPAIAYVWDIWETNVGINQIVKDGFVLGWSAKWLGDTEVMSDFVYKHTTPTKYDSTGEKTIAQSIHNLLSEADLVVGHNGDSFDLKWLNAVFIKHNLPPLPKIRSIDTLKQARKVGRFISNKLDFLVRKFNLGKKISTGGFELWTDCLEGKLKSWKLMEKYCKHDTRLLERLYVFLRPYMASHPNLALVTGNIAEGKVSCPVCRSYKIQKRGYSYTDTAKFPRFQCQACTKWFRGSKAESRTGLVSA